MNVYSQGDSPQFDVVRSHPWTESAGNATSRYYDFKLHAELIPFVLEDFRPWSQTQAIQNFYRLLTTLNGPDSPLETNDCAFIDPSPNVAAGFAKQLQASGRVMVLFRDLILNTRRDRVDWLESQIQQRLGEVDRHFPWTAVATAIVPTRYLELSPSHAGGYQLALHFFAWGDSATETIEHFGRIVSCLEAVLPDVATEILRSRAAWLSDQG